jgi:hypothetical protein
MFGAGQLQPGSASSARARDFFGATFQRICRAAGAGAIDIAAVESDVPTSMTPLVESLILSGDASVDPRLLQAMLSGWASVSGYLSLELAGHMTWFTTDTEAAYAAHLRSVLGLMGFRPTATSGTA